ncbi:MAG: metallophosphoesterase [Planctomycetes bacterium]|nr:metallophosphoesterase [Planctomycetota bacterium]
MTPWLWTLLVLNACFDGAVLLGLLRWRRTRPLGLARLVLALAGTFVVFAAKAPILARVAHNGFYVIHLLYVDVVVVAPLVALLVLTFRDRGGLTSSARVAASLGLALAPIGVWATFVEPERLVEERVEVRVDPAIAPSEPLRIAVLADMQSPDVDRHLERAVRMALAFEPHLILLPGDLIQRRDARPEVAEHFRELLMPLVAPLGTYFVLGNTDHDELVLRALQGTPVRLLRNEVATFEFAGRQIAIGGADADRSSAFVRAFDRRRETELRILVAHFPDVLLGLDDEPGIHLTVAGHTHGGQVQVPFFGPLLTLSDVPRAVAGGGLHELARRPLYVSRGVGCERICAPKVRFLCPPEVTLLTLRAD